jgi:hypothetical protein
MNEMVKRAVIAFKLARLKAECWYMEGDERILAKAVISDYEIACVIAIIEAMREPTDAMIEVGIMEDNGLLGYRAMIDAALVDDAPVARVK